MFVTSFSLYNGGIIMTKDKCNFIDSSWLFIIILTMILGGVFGFIYETLFYRIDLGYFVKRGSTFGPWIPIYAFGSLFLTLLSYPHRKHPLLVFLLSLVVTTVLEYGTGYVLLHFFHIRLWDYNTEIWNYGNINGFICLRSVLLFAFSGLFLVYWLIPFLFKIQKKIPSNIFQTVSLVLLFLFVTDMGLFNLFKLLGV